MKTTSVRELKSRLSHFLNEAEKEDIIVTSHGKPRAVLSGFSDESLEDYVISNSPDIRQKVEEAYGDYIENGGVSLDKIIKKFESKGKK